MATRLESGATRVTLSVDGHAYTAEIRQESEADWILLGVRVHQIGTIGSLNLHGRSCLEALRLGEVVAQEITSCAVDGLDVQLLKAPPPRD